MTDTSLILIRGGGDLASGVALRLHRAGLRVAITELPQPLVVRRLVSFAEAVYSGEAVVEGVRARRADSPEEALEILAEEAIPVLVDPQARAAEALRPAVLVDGRMLKRPPDIARGSARLVIGLGPGFTAGVDCDAVVETNRGHRMGRVIWQGAAEADTGIPENVRGWVAERVLRAPADGRLEALAGICDRVRAGQKVAEVGGQPVLAPFDGVLRGLLHPGVDVRTGTKIGDVDPRGEAMYCTLVSDKSLAVGGGVLEAILSQDSLRQRLWS